MTIDRLWRLAPSLGVAIVVPVIAYWLGRPHVGGDTAALAIAGAIPAAWTAGRLAWRNRLEPVGVVGVVGFGAALLVSALSGGSALPLKLQDSVVTGVIGLACLASVALRRPLLAVLLRLLRRAAPAGRPLAAITTIIGATLLVHAVAHAIVALTLPTSAYLVLSRLVGVPIYLAGAVVLLWYVRRPHAGVAPGRRPA
jgi:hypothetical protein